MTSSRRVSLPLNDPSQWPLRMTVREVAHVWRKSRATVYRYVTTGRFPQPDGDHQWARDTVVRYLQGGIQQFDHRFAREQRKQRSSLKVAG